MIVALVMTVMRMMIVISIYNVTFFYFFYVNVSVYNQDHDKS